jgi:diguanylate cyclase (GGDEF)-like protein
MTQPRTTPRSSSLPAAPDQGADATPLVEIGHVADRAGAAAPTPSDVLVRMEEAEDALRAIGAGEVDAFVLSDGGTGRRVFTMSTADRPYRMFVENMRDGAATLSSSGLILYANQRLADLLSCPREMIVGSPLAMFMAGGIPIGLHEMRGPGGLGDTLEFDLVDANGVTVPVLVGTSPLEVDGDRLTCLTFTDLSAQQAQDREIARLSEAQAERLADLHEARAALTEQATHDTLTGLPNRALLVDRIEQALTHCERSGQSIAVLFVDLDGFKQLNDTHGHAAGDTALRTIAEKLVGTLRPMDTVARIGADEFVVLACGLDSHLQAVDAGTRLMTELCRRPDRIEDGDCVVASVGISVSVGGRGTAEILLKEADTAMCKAKSLGGGRAEVFDVLLARQVRQRADSLRTLQSALDERRAIPYYQPLVDLSSGKIAGFEALARIIERDGSILSPAAFIPVAEESGLVVPLGAQVLTMACEEAHGWQRARPPESRLTVAVNLSFRQFESGDLWTLVQAKLEQTGLDPRNLHLELTETAVIDLSPDTLHQLGRIRDLGVEIGLDDFGTGYASLTHLRRLPLTFVKIDRSFVQGVGTDQEDERIVAAVVDLAANLGLRSIGEGVETKEQLARLRELGCDQAQGFLFARPLPANEVPGALQHSAW